MSVILAIPDLLTIVHLPQELTIYPSDHIALTEVISLSSDFMLIIVMYVILLI